MADSKELFTQKVSDYVRYRPGYPEGVVALLQPTFSLTPTSRIADIGAGTGIFTRLLLQSDLSVIAVEPNDAMRAEADRQLGAFHRYQSAAGSAEDTALDPESIDLIVSAQAFHWFDRDRARQEFRRILKPSGGVALIWNLRDLKRTAFAREFDAILYRHCDRYKEVVYRKLSSEDVIAFLGPTAQEHTFKHSQFCNFEELLGRVTSTSYCPDFGRPKFEALQNDLRGLFNRYQKHEKVEIEYDTVVYTCPDYVGTA